MPVFVRFELQRRWHVIDANRPRTVCGLRLGVISDRVQVTTFLPCDACWAATVLPALTVDQVAP